MRQKTQNHFIKFSIHLSVRKSRENYGQIYGKSQASLWRNLSSATPPKFFMTILCFVALVYNSYFFRTAVLRKLFDIRFSYICLLVKMASKTVTRSIPAEVNSKGGKCSFGQPASKIRYYNLSITQVRYIKSSPSESKPFQSRFTVEIPGPARHEEQLSRSKLKQAFLIDSDAALFMYLIQCIRFGS